MTQAFERRLRRFLALALALPRDRVLRGNSNGREPADGVFATVLLVGDRQVGHADQQRTTDNTTTRTKAVQQRLAEYSVQVFRGRDPADHLLRWLDSDLAKIEEQRHGLRVQEAVELTQTDEQVDAGWEDRIVVKLKVGYTSDVTQDTGRITSVPWNVRNLTRTERGTVNA